MQFTGKWMWKRCVPKKWTTPNTFMKLTDFQSAVSGKACTILAQRISNLQSLLKDLGHLSYQSAYYNYSIAISVPVPALFRTRQTETQMLTDGNLRSGDGSQNLYQTISNTDINFPFAGGSSMFHWLNITSAIFPVIEIEVTIWWLIRIKDILV